MDVTAISFLIVVAGFVCFAHSLFSRKVVIPKIIVNALKQNYLTIRRPIFVSDGFL